MLSAVETFTICVLLLVGAPALTGKNEKDPEFEKSGRRFDSKQTLILTTAQLFNKVEVNRKDHHQANRERKQEMKLMDQLRTNVKKNHEPELNEELPTNVQGTHDIELEVQSPIRVENHTTKVKVNQEAELTEQLPYTEGSHKILKLDERLPANAKVNQEIGIREQLPENIEEQHDVVEFNAGLPQIQNQNLKLEKQPSTNVKETGVPSVKMDVEDQHMIGAREGHTDFDIQQLTKVQDTQHRQLEEQRPTKLKDSIKRKPHDVIQIDMKEDCVIDHERGVSSMWTKLQTRGGPTGPVLGYKKGHFRRSVSNCISRTASYIGNRLSSRKGKPNSPENDKRASFNKATDSFISKPWVKKPEGSPQDTGKITPRLRQPAPWVPPPEPFEPFCVADSIQNIVMIPGSGEFVYDTEIQKKTKDVRKHASIGQSINENNDEGKSDAVVSLNQLKEDLPNVKWISVVVNWFANNLNIKDCQIYPAVEFKDGFIVTPDDWQVENYSRTNAPSISRNSDGSARYGGTVSDGALLRYIQELHRRGYKVMLYPMLVFDTKEKEWRGKLTGPASEISFFFRNVYNPFIQHYARIAKQTGAEGFIIGSEFVGLTKIRDKYGKYPAVTELVKLAQDVKGTVGDDVTVTYAADWTEYHIASGGWYPLDELWASKHIDVVGINAYFPLSDYSEPEGGYTVKDVVRSWTLGEGYSYFYDYSKGSPELQVYPEREHSKWAWKNIEKWWSESHYNPDGSQTKWTPKMKKIWFTEFGFPSVDACTTEPYVFVDGSEDSKYPRFSNKRVSFRSQLVAIEGTLRKWTNSEAVEKMFLYAWDARPFPYFPNNRELWGDAANWETGHWVQGKIRKLPINTKEPVVSAYRSLSQPKRSSSSGAPIRRLSRGNP